VAYGGEYGPDLDDVARHTGLTPGEVVARHASAQYIVACMGFAPGWAYLLGLPPELEIPRLPNPRTRVPAGSVGIGGAQTGIYPLETPGGWRLIGRTPLRMFDPGRAEPSLLRPGDRVLFQPISHEQFRAIAGESGAGVSDSGELAAGRS
jgi:KipI family sensor histidine kinase inhibitor